MKDTVETPRVVTIYMEQTPNPEALMFVTNLLLLPEGSVEYTSKAETTYCPLASQLFDFTGVKNVFITSNFVTVTKVADLDWWEIQNIVREFIRGFLLAGDAIFTKDPFEEKSGKQIKVNTTVEPETIKEKRETISSTPELEEQIKQLLEEYVKPAVAQDGGAIDFKSFEDGVVTVTLKGSCSGCPSSTQTLKAGIERLLKQMMPSVKEVVAE
jgi:Fe-S cluster biogenesis protein NfuA